MLERTDRNEFKQIPLWYSTKWIRSMKNYSVPRENQNSGYDSILGYHRSWPYPSAHHKSTLIRTVLPIQAMGTSPSTS